eukprot:jgi/Phyca11/118251/e_gw1.35.247.1
MQRQLPYEALDPEWEAREFQKFRAAAGTVQQQAPYGAYLFGRLMQSDLHQSCQPALPPDVAKLNGSTIQGMCILQVVDVANIGANYEHRTEFSTAGSARTLKLGLTDGHQLVFGFEYISLPQFSVNVPRGTKVIVENVPVRHGLLMLGPDNCQLLETSADFSGRNSGQVQQPTEANGLSAGAYSAALVTSQFNTGQQQPIIVPTRSQQPVTGSPAIRAPTNGPPRTNTARNINPPAPSNSGPSPRISTGSTASSSGAPKPAAVPSVFVDIPSSDEDMDSDTTDPMVEHLFYSPKTPRFPVNVDATTQASNRVISSRKRPRGVAPTGNPTRPFQYFTARLSVLSSLTQSITAHRFQIRACIKSVVGFQFNTGKYQLRVSVEDCTATKEADVAEDFVTRLMGVPCSEFLQTMQTKVHVAHGWAANMQFALMNLEGVMTFEKGVASAGSAPLLLVDCRDFQPSDTRELLQRVKTLLHVSHATSYST